jgi:hypothetical protein
MKNDLLKKYFNGFLEKHFSRIESDKGHIMTLLYKEYNIRVRKNKIDIVYHRELPYTIIVDDTRKFLYKTNIGARTPNIESFDIIKKDFEKCFTSTLLPNILNETLNFYEVEYFDNDNYRIFDTENLYILFLSKNKNKILNYYETIKNNNYCIVDFELQNFIFNIHTNEIFLIYSGDMDKCETFNPNIFSIDTFDEKSTFFIANIINEFPYNLSKTDYINNLSKLYPNCNIKFL